MAALGSTERPVLMADEIQRHQTQGDTQGRKATQTIVGSDEKTTARARCRRQQGSFSKRHHGVSRGRHHQKRVAPGRFSPPGSIHRQGLSAGSRGGHSSSGCRAPCPHPLPFGRDSRCLVGAAEQKQPLDKRLRHRLSAAPLPARGAIRCLCLNEALSPGLPSDEDLPLILLTM